MLDTKLLSEDLQKFSITNTHFWETSKDSSPRIKELYDHFLNSDHCFLDKNTQRIPPFFYCYPERESANKTPSDIYQYEIAAIDGSQVESDDLQTQTLPFFIINIGVLLIDYPKKTVKLFQSIPELFSPYKIKSELNQNTDFISTDFNTIVTVFRTKKEFDYACQMTEKVGKNGIIVMDGGLIQWHLQDKPDRWKEYAMEPIRNVFAKSIERQVHMIGYISGTKSSDVLGSMRILHCQKSEFNCMQCQDDLCQAFSQVSDEYLFREILPIDPLSEWQISPLFESTASILTEYNGHRIFFFYVYNNEEFARVECAEHSLAELDRILISLLDQLKKGFGYPVVLQEAHELAVISMNDRLVLDQCLFHLGKNKNQFKPLRSKNSSKRIKYI